MLEHKRWRCRSDVIVGSEAPWMSGGLPMRRRYVSTSCLPLLVLHEIKLACPSDRARITWLQPVWSRYVASAPTFSA